MFTYLIINLLTVLGPLIFSFESRVRYVQKWRYLFPALLLSAVVFIVWDHWFTKWGVWGFNPAYTLGLDFFSLPLEEIIFFFAIPFACVFIYEVVGYFDKESVFQPLVKPATLLLGSLFLIVAAANPGKIYTSITFFAAAVFLYWHFYRLQGRYLARFYLMFLFSLIPFFIVNGVLTNGLPWIDPGPVVWYNNAQNLGLRVMGIPVEDFVYSFLMLLTVVTFYEFLKIKAGRQSAPAASQGAS